MVGKLGKDAKERRNGETGTGDERKRNGMEEKKCLLLLRYWGVDGIFAMGVTSLPTKLPVHLCTNVTRLVGNYNSNATIYTETSSEI